MITTQRNWYKGDFHLHTTSSDAIYTPDQLVGIARGEGLDFITITDHNSIGAFPQLTNLDGFLVIQGIEITTPEGHWNVFGFDGRQDWMRAVDGRGISVSLGGEYPTIPELLGEIHSKGLLNSINHPLLQPWEWQVSSTYLRLIDCLEIWNDPLWPDNAKANPLAIGMWTRWLNQGLKITAIGGSDFHLLPGDNEAFPGERPGLPTTYVAAPSLTSGGILNGLRQHQAYVSIGPRIAFVAEMQGVQYEIGDQMPDTGAQVDLHFSISAGKPGCYARIIQNGEILQQVSDLKDDQTCHVQVNAEPGVCSWYRLDIFDADGAYLVVTNPIYYADAKPKDDLIYGDFVVNNQII